MSLRARREREAGPSDTGGTASCSGIANSGNSLCALVESGRKRCHGTGKQAMRMWPLACLYLTYLFWPDCCVCRSLHSFFPLLEVPRRAMPLSEMLHVLFRIGSSIAFRGQNLFCHRAYHPCLCSSSAFA